MKETLNRLKKVVSNCAVTLVLRTHRTHPENEKDSIKLKNMASETRQRLEKEYSADIAKKLGDKLDALIAEIDIRYNLEGLVLFVDEEHAEYVRLPIKLNDRISIDNTFTTRSLFRALNLETRYYLLILSKDKARLLRATTDYLEKEYSDPFPMETDKIHIKTKGEDRASDKYLQIQQEYFNRVDKEVNKIHNKESLPIYIATDSTNYAQYMLVADSPNRIYGQVALENREAKASNIVKEVWPIIREQTKKKLLDRKAELSKAVSSGKVLSDYAEIWQAIIAGRGQTLFVQEGLYQPARLKEDQVQLIEKADIHSPEDIDDIIDEMIEKNSFSGGDVVFLPQEELIDFQGLALVTRY